MNSFVPPRYGSIQDKPIRQLAAVIGVVAGVAPVRDERLKFTLTTIFLNLGGALLAGPP